MNDEKETPRSHFHSSEAAIHQRFGISKRIVKKTHALIREVMPQQHRDFFEHLPMIIIATTDHHGQPWATPITGTPPFITSPNNKTLIIQQSSPLHNILQLDLHAGKKIGVLGIDLSTRRRNRMNGIIKRQQAQGLSIHVEQSFGNCKKYIQPKTIINNPTAMCEIQEKNVTQKPHLNPTTCDIIQHSDTFFIASRTHVLDSDARHGLDASHRGGQAGFVTVKDRHTLRFPDFKGNQFFNTLGNIESDNRVGLFFINFNNGDTVFISGTATIIWNTEPPPLIKDRGRVIEVSIQRVIYIPHLIPFDYRTSKK
jgi:predicted pyridoxine 5'-phosphate oxidase superfamily flavin-nucleotide-binding protein